jgi:hypothetical protein
MEKHKRDGLWQNATMSFVKDETQSATLNFIKDEIHI